MTQADALEILKMGHNVFLTGQPGAGKTYTLNQYIGYLKSHDINVAITASTGIAATHIGGTTIHSWSGVGVKKNLSERDIDDLSQREYLVKRLDKAKVLIIDEVSMMDADMINDVNNICKTLKRSNLPFGGLQIILVGDFFQLPPINKTNMPVKFAYQAEAWQQAKLAYCYLSEQHRQTGDDEFNTILQELRTGEVSSDSYNELIRSNGQSFSGDIEPVRLHTHNLDVDRVNNERLAELEGELYTFSMKSRGKDNHKERLIKSCLSPENLQIKIGAMVMCTKNNFEIGYVNGTMGQVVDIDSKTKHPIIKTTDDETITIRPAEWAYEDDGRSIASIEQIPLRLAWAITVHKSQGMSIDRAEMDLSQTFEYGQGYVALSRVRTLAGLRLLGLNDTALQVHPEILKKDQRFLKLSEAAEQRLTEIDPKIKKEKQTEFILKMGGSLEAKEVITDKKGITKVKKVSTYQQTQILLEQEKSLKQIVKERDLTMGTIVSHIERLLDNGSINSKTIKYLQPKTKKFAKDQVKIKAAFKATKAPSLGPVFHELDGKFTYDELRFARLFL